MATIQDKPEFQPTLSIRRETYKAKLSEAEQKFQPTLSIRRETRKRKLAEGTSYDFNPLSPYGERQETSKTYRAKDGISTHSLHTERDKEGTNQSVDWIQFQPTLSIRRETIPARFFRDRREISTHSLHTERDILVSG